MSKTIITKQCSQCKQIKPLSEFWKNLATKDGYQYPCKNCSKQYLQKHRQTEKGKKAHREEANRYRLRHLQKIKVYHKRWRQTEKGKIVIAILGKQYRLRNPEKIKAQTAVSHAIRAGKLPRPDSLQCVCDNPAKEYHHPSYAPEHRLDVIPVCVPCHIRCHNLSASVSKTS